MAFVSSLYQQTLSAPSPRFHSWYKSVCPILCLSYRTFCQRYGRVPHRVAANDNRIRQRKPVICRTPYCRSEKNSLPTPKTAGLPPPRSICANILTSLNFEGSSILNSFFLVATLYYRLRSDSLYANFILLLDNMYYYIVNDRNSIILSILLFNPLAVRTLALFIIIDVLVIKRSSVIIYSHIHYSSPIVILCYILLWNFLALASVIMNSQGKE